MHELPPILGYTPGLPLKELHAELDLANAVTSLGRRKLARYLADMEERDLYVLSGHASAIHYAKTKLGMKHRTAQDYVLTGIRLEQLPEIDTALYSGEISWSKAKTITRVAVCETEKDWLEFADKTGCDQLSSVVARSSLGDRPPCGQGGLPEIMITVRAELSVLNHELWDQAKRKLAAEMKMTVTNGDMCNQVARLILSTDDDGSVEGRTKVAHYPYQLVIHQEGAEARVPTSHGDVVIRAEQVARLASRAEIIRIPEEKLGGQLPQKMREFVLARDGYKCTNCMGGHGVQVHHIEFQSLGGGHAAANLASLCSRCHAMIHTGLLKVRRDALGMLCFSSESGQDVDAVRPAIPANELVQMMQMPADAGRGDRIGNSMMLVRARKDLAPSPEFRIQIGAWSQ